MQAAWMIAASLFFALMSDDVFASTIQAGLDPLMDEMDEEAIERSIAEINEAIQRTKKITPP